MSKIAELKSTLDKYKQTSEGVAYSLRLDLSDLIINGMKNKNITQKQFAQIIDVKESYLSRVINNNQNFTIDIAAKILHALDVQPKLVNNYLVTTSDRPTVIMYSETNTEGLYNYGSQEKTKTASKVEYICGSQGIRAA